MIIILLALLIIALTITFAGLLLSTKPQAPTPRKMSYATRGTTPTRALPRGATRALPNGATRVLPHATTRVLSSEQEFRAGRRVYQDDQQAYRPRRGSARKYVMTFEARYPVPTRELELDERWLGWPNLAALFNIRQLFASRSQNPTPWLGACLILIALFGIGLFAMAPLFSGSGVVATFSWTQPFAPAPPPSAPPAAKPDPMQELLAGTTGASKALSRLYQLDPAQYGSSQDFDTWAPSACSAASMTEVINSYGHTYKIADILKVEADLGQISPELGLLRPTGIDATVNKFGFKAIHLNNPSLDDILKVANTGKPVIVSFPPERWTGGHILVLRGGRDDKVYLADSSQFNMTVVPRSTFQKYWGGFAVVVMPS